MDTDKAVFITVLLITTLSIGGIVYSSTKKSPTSRDVNSNSSVLLENESVSNILQDVTKERGAKKGVLTIVEFSDFECPYCKNIQPAVSAILEKYPNDVRLVFKSFPLSFHKGAMPAAKAAEAAAKQGMFAEYHDKLFDNQPNFSDDDLVKYAEEVGLDIDRFNADRKSADVSNQVSRDLQLGRKLQVRGTPTFYFIYNDKVKEVNMKSTQDFIDQVDVLMRTLKSVPSESSASENIDN